MTTPVSEREKMLAGLIYDSRDSELMALHRKARQLLGAYNTSYDPATSDRMGILQQLFASVGEGTWIEPPFFCDYGCHIHFGKHSFANFNCVFLDCNYIYIGDYVLLAPGVHIYAVTHPVATHERLVQKGNDLCYTGITAPVTIKDKAWLGGGTHVLPGVTIGEGAVIGAGSVVTRDIPDYTVAVGNPCRVIRSITPGEEVRFT